MRGTRRSGADERLIWMNRTNTLPTRGQATAYTLFSYTADEQVIRRDRRTPGGVHQDVEPVLGWR